MVFGRNDGRRRWAWCVVLAGGLFVPFACGDDADGDGAAVVETAARRGPPSTAATPSTALAELKLPEDVRIFVEFPRYLHAARRLEVGFDNRSDTELTVIALALRSPLFEPVAPDPRDTDIEVGRRRDLQIGVGPSVCPPPSGPSMVEVTAEIGGVRRHGLVEVDSTPLGRISAEECGREFVLERVAIAYAHAFAVADGVVETIIDIERLDGDDPLAVTAVRGSVLLELKPTTSATPLAAIASGEDRVSIPVSVRVIRCDPHAVIESKKTFELSIWVSLGDRVPQRLVVAPTGELRSILEQLIQDCLRDESG